MAAAPFRGAARGFGMGLLVSESGTELGVWLEVESVLFTSGRLGLAGFEGIFSSKKVEGAQPSLTPIFTNHHPSLSFSITSIVCPSLNPRHESVSPE